MGHAHIVLSLSSRYEQNKYKMAGQSHCYYNVFEEFMQHTDGYLISSDVLISIIKETKIV